MSLWIGCKNIWQRRRKREFFCRFLEQIYISLVLESHAVTAEEYTHNKTPPPILKVILANGKCMFIILYTKTSMPPP